MHQYSCTKYRYVCVFDINWTTQYNSCNNFGSPFFLQLFSWLFYDNIWPNYVYGAWAAGNENGKTGNNKVSDKSFPTVTVPPLGVRVSVCVPAIECVPVCVCECESDTLIDVITCALNIYCIGRRHGTFFFTSPCACVCVCVTHTSGCLDCQYILPFTTAGWQCRRQRKQKLCQRSRKQLLEDV